MKRASYRDGVFWIAANDDTEWIDEGPNSSMSVTACLLADLFGVNEKKLRWDLQRQLCKLKERGNG